MQIIFLGTRGSIPAPGPNTVKFGGNTTCVKFISQDNNEIIIDAGTGIRKLNVKPKKIIETKDDYYIFFTHSHWDHLQGFPFIAQLFNPNKTFHLMMDIDYYDVIKDSIIKQMSGKSFPVQFDRLPCEIKFVPVDGEYRFDNNLKINLFKNNHPGGATAIKITDYNKIFTFVTDNEISLLKKKELYNDFVDYCKGSDIIVHDGQYLNKEMKIKGGYGHSTLEEVVELFIKIKPKIGIFTHHDPERKDKMLEKMEKAACEKIKDLRLPIKIIASRENTIVKF